MESSSVASWLTLGLSPSVSAILFAVLLVLLSPLLLHSYIYRSKARTDLPAFLSVGPSDAGKTSLLTLFERGKAAETHTSQTSLTIETSLPGSTVPASSRYRSVNDPSNQIHRKFLLVDTPGHGKLRHLAFQNVVKPQNLKGIIFVVDAATLSTSAGDSNGLTEASQYLHDVLLALQRRHTSAKSSRGATEMPVLIAANKLDLFTALPAKLVRKNLEMEIAKLRSTKAKGLIDSGIGMDDDKVDEQDMLGGNGEGKFEFGLMEEYNVPIDVLGGSVFGNDGSDTKDWWQWISRYL